MTNSYRIWQKKGKECDKIKRQKNDQKEKLLFCQRSFKSWVGCHAIISLGAERATIFGNFFQQLLETFFSKTFGDFFFNNFQGLFSSIFCDFLFFENCWPNLNYPQKRFLPPQKRNIIEEWSWDEISGDRKSHFSGVRKKQLL